MFIKNNIRKVFVVFGVSYLLSCGILLYVTFLNAFFHNYRTVVLVNVFNEAWFEFFLFPIGLFCGFYFLWLFSNGRVSIKRNKFIYSMEEDLN